MYASNLDPTTIHSPNSSQIYIIPTPFATSYVSFYNS